MGQRTIGESRRIRAWTTRGAANGVGLVNMTQIAVRQLQTVPAAVLAEALVRAVPMFFCHPLVSSNVRMSFKFTSVSSGISTTEPVEFTHVHR